MPKIDSPLWDQRSGMCLRHYLPQIPCPQCLAERDPNVEVRLTETDRSVLKLDPDLSVRHLLPSGEDGDWLLERVVE